MRVLVCGSRFWSDWPIMLQRLNKLPQGCTIIEGGCKGADLMARRWAELYNVPVIELKAEWARYGSKAGPIRNRKMLDLNPGLVLAFHSSIVTSKGTRDTLAEAQRRLIPTELIEGNVTKMEDGR